MKKYLKLIGFFAITLCSLWIIEGKVKADNTPSRIGPPVVLVSTNINNGYGGTITMTKNNCVQTSADSESSNVITITSGGTKTIEALNGCNLEFKVTVNEGYEVDSVLFNGKAVQSSSEKTYSILDIQPSSDGSTYDLAVKYKKKEIGNDSNKNLKIDVINGQDGSGIDYGTITTTWNSGCTVTAPDTSSSNIITIRSGQQLYVEVNPGCTQTFQVTVNEGYEIDTVLVDRQYVQPSADGVYTFSNITTANSLLSTNSANVAHSLCIKYKKKGAPSSPGTGDVAYVLPVVGAALLSLGLMIILVRKNKNVKA